MANVAVGADALQPLAAATVRQEMQNWVSFPNFWLAHGENWDKCFNVVCNMFSFQWRTLKNTMCSKCVLMCSIHPKYT